MTVAEIVRRVRSAIDELMENQSEFLSASTDEANLTATIIDKIGYALVYIIENAPDDKLDSDLTSTLTTTEIAAVTRSSDGMVRLLIPDDVLRIVSARLSSWKYSPTPVSEFSQEYMMQTDTYAKGTWDRPVTAIVYSKGKRYLEFYSYKESSDTPDVSVIRKPTVSDGATLAADLDTEVSVPSRLEGAFIYQVAALSMVAFRESIAQQLFQIAQQYLTATIQRSER